MAARKKSETRRPKPNFEVRLIAPGISPDQLSLGHVNDVLSAVQDLASGRDRAESSHVPPEQTIGLVDVDTGSAVYRCVAHAPEEAESRLAAFATCLKDAAQAEPDVLLPALEPLESLCHVAKSHRCRIDVRWTKGRRRILFSIGADDYDRLAASMLVEGETSVAGNLKRIGGATEMRCVLHVPGRRRLLYCSVADRDLAQRLGRHLYEDVVVSGTAVRLRPSWRIHRFTVKDFCQPSLGDVETMLDRLREAGLNAWDEVEDPAALLGELRS